MSHCPPATPSSYPSPGNPMPASGSPPSNIMSDPWMQVPAGYHTQYAKNGPGFTPVQASVSRLPAALYQIAWINDQPTFVRTSFSCDDLVRLPDSKSDEVIAEIEKFWTLAPVFKKFGYTHKRGFLLHGPPGSGKTSTIVTVIQQMIASDGVVVMAGGKIDPDTLAMMLRRFREIEPERHLVVTLEDIDAYIKSFGEDEILALLDGEASLGGVVYIATTNYPEDLDGRMTNRPSRFDKVVEIGPPSPAARRIYFKSRLGHMTEEEISAWVDGTAGLSIAHCKELIISVLCLGQDFNETVERVHSMSKTPSSTSPSRPTGFNTGKNASSTSKPGHN